MHRNHSRKTEGRHRRSEGWTLGAFFILLFAVMWLGAALGAERRGLPEAAAIEVDTRIETYDPPIPPEVAGVLSPDRTRGVR